MFNTVEILLLTGELKFLHSGVLWPCRYAGLPVICLGRRLLFLVQAEFVFLCAYALLYLNALQAVSYCIVLKLQEIPTLFSQVIQQEGWFQFYCVWRFKMARWFSQNQKAVS